MNWEGSTDIHIPPCVKQIAGGKLLNSRGSSAGRGVGWEAQEGGGDICI